MSNKRDSIYYKTIYTNRIDISSLEALRTMFKDDLRVVIPYIPSRSSCMHYFSKALRRDCRTTCQLPIQILHMTSVPLALLQNFQPWIMYRSSNHLETLVTSSLLTGRPSE